MEGVQMHQDGIGLNAWMTGHGAHRELRTVDLDRAGPVASGHRQEPIAPRELGQCSFGAMGISRVDLVKKHQ